MYKIIFPLLLTALIFSGCDQLGIDPNVNIDDCLTQKDRDNYSDLILNEKQSSAILMQYSFDPELVPESERQSVYDQLVQLNNLHDGFRSAFECQYWGEDNKLLTNIAEESADQIDPVFLDPSAFKATFKVELPSVLSAINQSHWEGKKIYIFPGISRIPWEGASQANKEKALERINKTFIEILTDLGESNGENLFDPIEDYIFPHATYHQVYVANFASAVISQDNSELLNLLVEMKAVEENIVEKFILRAPDTIDL